jgi:FKBP-type peptidyl-prolyl cis-trans isomerase 2
MQIAEGMVVSIEFSLCSASGETIERTEPGQPISFTMGPTAVLPGLARALAGMSVGESRQGIIPPGSALQPVSNAVRRSLRITPLISDLGMRYWFFLLRSIL